MDYESFITVFQHYVNGSLLVRFCIEFLPSEYSKFRALSGLLERVDGTKVDRVEVHEVKVSGAEASGAEGCEADVDEADVNVAGVDGVDLDGAGVGGGSPGDASIASSASVRRCSSV